jgi:hypothetical protein
MLEVYATFPQAVVAHTAITIAYLELTRTPAQPSSENPMLNSSS